MARLKQTLCQEHDDQAYLNEKYPPHNPITKSGEKVLGSMKSEYGEKKGKQVFYASINAGKKGSKKWER